MEPGPKDPMRRLQRAIALADQYRDADDGMSVGEFVRQHEEYRDLLEPMLENADPSIETERVVAMDYRIVRAVGRGGMGEVYEAEQLSLMRSVALKLLRHPDFSEPQAVARFRREAESLGRLRHEGIVRVFDFIECEEGHALVMELVYGAPLDRVLGAFVDAGGEPDAEAWEATVRRLSIRARSDADESEAGERGWRGNHVRIAVELILQVAEALDHAHKVGVIHRDVKPSNILVRPDGRAVLTDFGLAREAGKPTVTADNVFAGSPGYMSPDQIAGANQDLDHRTDLFSLGVTLFELLTLVRPFRSSSTPAELDAIVSRPTPDLAKARPGSPRDLAAIVTRCLEKDRRDRYQSAGQLADDLRAFLEFQPIRARPVGYLGRLRRWVQREPMRAGLTSAVLVAGLVAVGMGGYLWLQADSIRLGRDAAAKAALERDLAHGHRLLITPNRFAEAEAVFARLWQVRPDDLDVAVSYALALRNSGDRNREERLLERLEHQWPEASVVRRLRANWLRRTGSRAASALVLAELGEPVGSLDWLVAGLIEFDESMNSMSDEPGARAFSLFRRACLASPERRRYQVAVLAEAARFAPDPEDGIAAARLIVELDPESPISWMTLGNALIRQDVEASRRAYERALELDPNQALVHYSIGYLHRLEGRLERAAECFRAALERDPELANGLAGLAAVERDLGNPEAALAAIERLLQLHPLLPAHRFNAGLTLREVGRPEAAVEQLQRVVQSVDWADAHYELGRALDATGKGGAAVAAYSRAVELAPAEGAYVNELAVSLAKEGDVAAAVPLFERATTLNPEDPLTHANWALSLIQTGQLEAGEQQLRACIKRHPDDPFAYRQLGVYLLRALRLGEASTMYAKARELEARAKARGGRDAK